MKLVERSREVRDRLFNPLARKLVKIKVTANILTTLAFICGLSAAYFLFADYRLFVLFIILHLFLDGLDGVVARITKPTTFGDYFDHITDQIVGLLLLGKIYLYLQDYFVLIIIFLELEKMFNRILGEDITGIAAYY